MICRICGQKMRDQRTRVGHHLEPSPIESDLCVGCWKGGVDFELWILRATGHSFFSLKLQQIMKGVLAQLRSGDPQ